MPRPSRADALEEIASWPTADVVALLQKNGVEEACWKAVEKRQIDGDELLHLTEGKLALWKSDLTRSLIWSLWTFVEELKKCPEDYIEDKKVQHQQQQQQQQQPEPLQMNVDTLSDTGSWDTDFEDSVDDPADGCVMTDIRSPVSTMSTTTTTSAINSDFRNSLRLFQENDRIKMENDAKGSSYSINSVGKSTVVSESTYANCEILSPESESTYANVGFADTSAPKDANPTVKCSSKPYSLISGEQQQSLAEKLKEQLMLLGAPPSAGSKPAIVPKPEGLCRKSKDEVILRRSEPRTSFLHKSAKSRLNEKMHVPPPAEPTDNKQQQQQPSSTEETLKNLPKPPVTIRGFDLVANLPTTRPVDESEDDDEEYDASYEAFDEQIVEQHQRSSMIRAGSGQSLASARQNSVESVYHPPSSLGHDDEVYEIYESITESPDENGHDFKNDSNTKNLATPPPLPAKPPPNITALQNHLSKADTKIERSLDKKSATLPHSGSNTSLTNAARPLPPPPDKQSYYERSWFHNLNREQANLLIEEQCTYGNASDGYFLMRPSTSNPNNPLTLVLWCKDRVYNVPVRRRPDNRFALGSSKPDEQSFASIDEIIPFYKREKLVLYTGGVQTGSTRLSDTPPK